MAQMLLRASKQPLGHRVLSVRWLSALLLSLSSGAFAADINHSPSPQVLHGNGDLAKSSTQIVELAAKYENGEAVQKDYQHALTLYCEAARQGSPTAFFNLGWMYLNGRGVPRNDSVAVAWLKRAADHGVAQAVNLLSLLRSTAPASDSGCVGPPRTQTAVVTAPPRVRALVERMAKEVGIDAQLVIAVIAAESAFISRAVSRRDARGLMQLMPETAARFGVLDRFDEEANIRAGSTYLRILLERFDGNRSLAVAAYNAGEGAIESYGGVPPFRETREYVERVKRHCACSDTKWE